MKNILKIALLGALFAPLSTVSAGNPFYNEGGFAVGIRAGIAPGAFKERAAVAALAAADSNALSGVSGSVEEKTFSDLYNLPFALGVDLGYFVNDSLEVFANFDFATAGAKEKTTSLSFADETIIIPSRIGNNFKSYAGYLGARGYSDTCESFVPFLSAKIGVAKFDEGSAGFSAGFGVGADYHVSQNIALTLSAEAIGTFTSNRFDKDLRVSTGSNPVNFVAATGITDTIKTVYSFPITFGLRFKL